MCGQRGWRLVLGVALGTFVAGLFCAAPAHGQQMAVQRVVYDNPIEGFSITIPADWGMATTPLGTVDIAIDVPSVSFIGFPALTFFYATEPPERQAQNIARLMQICGVAAPAIGPTDRPGEVQVTATLDAGPLGPLQTRWLCRSERGVPYVIAAFVRSELAARFREDIETALSTCHLIRRPLLWRFCQRPETAYRMSLPVGWKCEGGIHPMDPGSFVYSVQSADGLAGAFLNPRANFNTKQFVSAQELAQTYGLEWVRKFLPDAQLQGVRPYARARAYFTDVLKRVQESLGLNGQNPRVDKISADYIGTLNGVRIRARCFAVAIMENASPQHPLHPGFPERVETSGIWAPLDQFDKLYPIARGVASSLQMDLRWKIVTQGSVIEVITKRMEATERGHAAWDFYIRHGGGSIAHDPASGRQYDLPPGPGTPYLDGAGQPQLAPEGEEPPPGSVLLEFK